MAAELPRVGHIDRPRLRRRIPGRGWHRELPDSVGSVHSPDARDAHVYATTGLAPVRRSLIGYKALAAQPPATVGVVPGGDHCLAR
jgi:hypothetical protein